MAKITEISYQTKNKKRCNLYVDGEFFCGLSLETVFKNRLKIGQEIDKKELVSVIQENEFVEALNKAADYVSKSLKTKKQVKDYLLRKGYTEEIAWSVVDKLKEYDYVNDQEYSKRYIESTSKTQGKRLIEFKLMSKGVRKDEIENAYAETDINSKDNAKKIAEKYLRNKEITKENIAKTYRYLISKGFSYDEASFALADMREDN